MCDHAKIQNILNIALLVFDYTGQDRMPQHEQDWEEVLEKIILTIIM